MTIIPVFHSGEPFSVLDYMIEKGYKYLGISPNNNWREEEKRTWLHRVYSRHDFDTLGVKTHGFGYQSITGLAQFPMTTADSATWKVGGMFGEIIDPSVSSTRTKYTEGMKGIHVDNTPGGYSSFVKELCLELGFNPDELRTSYHARDKYNVAATVRLLQKEKVKMPLSLDLFDNDLFDKATFEKEVLALYEEKKLLGKDYTGSPQVETIQKEKVKRIKVEKQDTGKLF